jgi:hypothetical protein
MSERGEHFLKSLAGSRATVVGHPVPVADMGRVMFLEDVFLDSETTDDSTQGQVWSALHINRGSGSRAPC